MVVGWFTSRDRVRDLRALASEFEVAVFPASELESAKGEAFILDARAFPDLDAMLTARTALRAPVLLIVSPDEAARILPTLPDQTDLACDVEPPSLIVHRLRALLERTNGAAREKRLALFATARLDPLTDLPTRRALFKHLRRRPHRPYSLLMIDIDHFKVVNDERGHQAGDIALRELARRVVAVCADALLVARYGGEELAVVIEQPAERAVELAEEIRRVVRERPFLAGLEHELSLTVSIGVANARADEEPEAVIRRADTALYAAKARGRDCVIHVAQLEEEALRRDRPIELENFENMTRVISERVVEVITWHGRRLFQEMREQADIDSLTGLYSRRYFDRRLPFEFDTTRLTVALLDVDYFGAVNKTHGWTIGDQVLAAVARRVIGNVRTEDWVARYGGEEIAIIMHETLIANAGRILERIRGAIEGEPFALKNGVRLRVTASIGATEQRDGEPLLSLMERVSQQLLVAKRGGRNRVTAG